ncbi:hypothetical protein [Cellulosimicrobium sp. SL-1]|uniref:hypothetical protein n=1 Tax=Cellulosimicrobium sp. SL-1 TaxID=2699423 RepID=UPI0013D32D44|nr:hypothetical protein [Cellulosimicrobium sp. SL-1]
MTTTAPEESDKPEPLDPALRDILEWLRFQALKQTDTLVGLARLLDAESKARTGLGLLEHTADRRDVVLRALLIRAERNGVRRARRRCQEERLSSSS